MQEDLHNIEQIEKYLQGEMNTQESGAFETQLKADTNLASETNLMRDLIKGVRKGGESDLEKTIFEVRSKLQNEGFFERKEATIKPMKVRRNWLAYAAAIVALIAAAMFFLDRKHDQNIQMAMSSIEIENLPEMHNLLDSVDSYSLVADDAEQKDNLMNVMKLSTEGSIEEIKKAYERHFELFPNDEVGKYLYGRALLNKKLPNEAINHLISLSNNADFKYQRLAQLTLVKAHLTIGDGENVQAAKTLLQTLSLSNEKDYSNIAKQILKTMN